MAGAYPSDPSLTEQAERGERVGLDEWTAHTERIAGVTPTDVELQQAELRVRAEERHPTYGRGEDGEVVALTQPELAEVVPIAVRGAASDLGDRYDDQTRREIAQAVAEADGDRDERVQQPSAALPLDQQPHDDQRRVLHGRLGPKGLRRLIERSERGVAVDGAKARPIVELDLATAQRVAASGQACPKVSRPDGGHDDEVTIAGAGVVVDDHVTTVEEIIAREDARFGGVEGDPDWVAGGKWDDITQVAAGPRISGKRRNDKTPTARPATGPTTDKLHEKLLRDEGPSRKKPVMVSGRLSKKAQATLKAAGIAPGAILEAFAGAMMRTGAQAADVMRSLETGCFDPKLVDALDDPATATTPEAAA